jgi:peptidylprolyl isomerase
MGRAIPGFDQGFTGMKVGGKRRIFIPWQLAYGAKGRPGPDAAHPGIPPKSDLIFDVQLIEVSEMAMPPNHPMPVVHMPAGGGGQPGTSAPPVGAPKPQAAPTESAPQSQTTPQAQPAPQTQAAPQAQPAPQTQPK